MADHAGNPPARFAIAPEAAGAGTRATPRRLLWRFGIMSLVSMAAIMLLVGAGVFQVYRTLIVDQAERSSVALAQAIFVQERSVLVSAGADGSARMRVEDGDVAALDLRLSRFLIPFGVLKVKVYDTGRRIVYSTDKAIVGRVDAGNARLARVLETGAPDSHLVKKDEIADLHGQNRIRVDVVETYLAVRDGGETIGSFEIYVDVSRDYEDIASAVRTSLAVLLAVLVIVFGGLFVPMQQGTRRLETVLRSLRDLAATDALTGLFNRRHLFKRIHEEFSRMERARRREEPPGTLAIVMADIDRFKAINDSLGHAAGDEVLKQFSARLADCLRDYDVLGRHGGEEFLVLLPHTALDACLAVAERMRRRVADTPFEIDGRPIEVTASFGVALSGGEPGDAEAVVGRADEALYRAKREGRNRVASAA